MFHERHLQWVWLNRRAPAGRVAPLGQTSSRLFERLSAKVDGRTALEQAVGSLVDDDFHRHCRLGAVSRGTLTVEVDDPRMVAVLRSRWSGVLAGHLRRLGGKPSVREVVFRASPVGRAGG